MLTVVQAHHLPTTLHLSVASRRYCGDWLAQFLWAIENGVEQPLDLYAPSRPYDPRPRGALDPKELLYDPDVYLAQATVARPRLPAYACFLPPEPRLDFAGRRVYLYAEELPLVLRALDASGLLEAWQRYREGGSYQIYAFHRASASMQLTPKARATPGIGRVPEALTALFERRLHAG